MLNFNWCSYIKCTSTLQWHADKLLNGKPMFWWSHLANIYFSEPNFMKSENQLFMWKIISFLCTLSRLHFLYRDCLFFSSCTHHLCLSLPPHWNRPAGIITDCHSHLSPASRQRLCFSGWLKNRGFRVCKI